MNTGRTSRTSSERLAYVQFTSCVYGEKPLQLQQGSIYEDVLLFISKNWSFLEFPYIFKEVKTKKKISRQSWTKYLETFSRFSTISLQHSWSGTKLLLPHSEYMSHRATSDFNWEIRKFVNFNKISEMRIGRNSAYTVPFQKYTHQDFTRNLGKETCWRDAIPSSFVICIILCMTASLLLLCFNSCCFHCTKNEVFH